MAAYVASARIDRGRTRVAIAGRRVAEPTDGSAAHEAWFRDLSTPDQDELELRWEAIRERWSQLTFFLFDPESWR